MAGLSSIPVSDELGVNIAFDDDCDASGSKNIDYGGSTLYTIVATNGNASVVYLSIWDSTSPVVGTTAQDYCFPLAASDDTIIVVPAGLVFGSGLSFAATTDKGTAANTSPGVPIDVRVCTIPT